MYIKLTIILFILLLLTLNCFSDAQIDYFYLTPDQEDMKNEYLYINIGVTSGSVIDSFEVDITSLYHQVNGFLELINDDYSNEDCNIYKNDGKTILRFTDIPLDSKQLTCIHRVNIFQVPDSSNIFPYSVIINNVSQHPVHLSLKNLLFNKISGQHLPLLPNFDSTNSISYNDLQDINTGYQGILNSKITLLSKLNNFLKDVDISLSFTVNVNYHTLRECIIYHNEKRVSSFTPILNNPYFITLKVSNDYEIKCNVYTFLPIQPGDGKYTIQYKLPTQIGSSTDYSGPSTSSRDHFLPTARLSTTSIHDLKDGSPKFYEATIDFSNLNKQLYLRNIINYNTQQKKPEDVFLVKSNISSVKKAVSLTSDGLSLMIDGAMLTTSNVDKVTIHIFVTDYDEYLITPFLSSTDNPKSIHKYMIDFKTVSNSNIKQTPPLLPIIQETPNSDIYFGLNLNIAHFQYNINFPKYITVKFENNSNQYKGLNFIIKSTTSDKVKFEGNVVDTSIGNNYILQINNQQTKPSYTNYDLTNSYNSFQDPNFVFFPITIDFETNPYNRDEMSLMYISFRGPLSNPTDPFLTKTYKTSLLFFNPELDKINIPQDKIKFDQSFDVKASVELACDIRSIGFSLRLNSENDFHVNYCQIDGEMYTYGSGLSYDESSYDSDVSFHSKSTVHELCVTAHDKVEKKTYDLPIICSLFRTRELSLKEKTQTDLVLSFKSSTSDDYITKTIHVYLSTEIPIFNTVNADLSYFSAFYTQLSQPPNSQLVYDNDSEVVDNENSLLASIQKDDNYIGYFRVAFNTKGLHIITIPNYTGNFPFNLNANYISEDGDDSNKCTAEELYISGEYQIRITKVGVCHFNYKITSDTDNQQIVINYLEEVRIPQTNPELEETNQIVKHVSWNVHTPFLFQNTPSLTFTSPDIAGHAISQQYLIKYTFTSDMLMKGKNYLLKFKVQNAKVSDLSYTLDEKCPQFTDSSNSDEVVLTMKEAIISDKTNTDTYICQIPLSLKTYSKKSQLVELKVASHNINIEDYSSSIVNTNLFKLEVTKPVADYTTRRAQLEMNVNIINANPDAAPLKYYVLYTDDFNSKPKKCNYGTEKRGNYRFIGPITQKIVDSVNIDCELDINVKHISSAESFAYIMFYADFITLPIGPAVSDDAIKKLTFVSTKFEVPHNTNPTPVSSLVSILNWTYEGKESINKQLNKAKKLVADSAKTTKDKVFVIELTYSNSTQTSPYSTLSDFYTLSTNGNIQAKFGIQGNQFNQQDLQKALDGAIENNPDLKDLSTSVIIDDIIQQCLAADLGCGALCAPCTGNESCLSDFDCLSGICSFGKCAKLDFNSNDSFDLLKKTSVFYFSGILFFLISIML